MYNIITKCNILLVFRSGFYSRNVAFSKPVWLMKECNLFGSEKCDTSFLSVLPSFLQQVFTFDHRNTGRSSIKDAKGWHVEQYLAALAWLWD